MTLKFIDTIFSGCYAEYLDFFLHQKEDERLSYDAFCMIHEKCKSIVTPKYITFDEFKDMLGYAVILDLVKGTKIYCDKSWIYGKASLQEIVLFHSEELPSLKKYTPKQVEFLSSILDCFDNGCLFSKYIHESKNRINESGRVGGEQIKEFNIADILYISKTIGGFSINTNENIEEKNLFYSQLNDLDKDYIIHRRQIF